MGEPPPSRGAPTQSQLAALQRLWEAGDGELCGRRRNSLNGLDVGAGLLELMSLRNVKKQMSSDQLTRRVTLGLWPSENI